MPAKPATSGLSRTCAGRDQPVHRAAHGAWKRAENPGSSSPRRAASSSWHNLHVTAHGHQNINPKFDAFPGLRWTRTCSPRGRWGAPDPAGGRRMHEPRETGTMQNRVRMVALPAGQEPADPLAAGRAVVLGHPGGRGPARMPHNWQWAAGHGRRTHTSHFHNA
ncbi:hypothetical protein QJS66_13675 [Kocuria rhizophila]|nr:hypothetical protein QJS66_13675 [Kocuria rhizophila]